MHCVCYIRQSSEEAAKRDLSCPAQEQRFLADIAARTSKGESVTYEIAPWDEGKSGGDMDRDGLNWILTNLDRFQEVWTYDTDRLVRHDFYAPYIMRELRTRHIRLWGPWGEDGTTPMGRFMTDVRMRFGAYYREEVAEHTKLNRDTRLREGLWSGHPPTGYMFIDESGPGSRRILVPDPEAAPRVQAIFRMLAEGTSQRKACAMLGIPQTTFLWQKDNPLYIGLVYKNRRNIEGLESRTHATLWALAEDALVTWLYPGRQEPLIEPAIWDAVELRRRASPKNKVSRTHGLSGRFRCETCGGVLRVARNKGRRAPSLRCERCKWERSYRFAETAVLTALAILTDSPEFEKAVETELRRQEQPADTSHVDALVAERTKVSRQLDRALDLLIESDEISQAVKDRAVELKKRRDQLDGLIVEEKTRSASRPTTVQAWRRTKVQLTTAPVAKLWKDATAEEQRELLMGVFTRIKAGPDQITFQVRGLEMAFQLPWMKGDVPYREVAGPRSESMGDRIRGFAFLGKV
jgi:DNA invertase Pin-like site-specific DNA recombinase